MHTITSPVSNYTWRPDVICKSVRSDGRQISNQYRLTCGYGEHMEVVLRPYGYTKNFQFRVRLLNPDYSDMSQSKIQVVAQQINRSMAVVVEKELYSTGLDIIHNTCPFCSEAIGMTDGVWHCGSNNCSFDYTPESCGIISNMVDSGRIKTRGIRQLSSFSTLKYGSDSITCINESLHGKEVAKRK